MKAIRQLEDSLPCDASHRFPSVIVKPFELCVILAAVSATAAARLTLGIKAFYTNIMDLSIMIFPINPVWRGRFCLVDRARALQGSWRVLSGCPAASKAHASRTGRKPREDSDVCIGDCKVSPLAPSTNFPALRLSFTPGVGATALSNHRSRPAW